MIRKRPSPPKYTQEDPSIPNRLGGYLRQLRERRGLLQTDVAAETGIEQSMLSRIERKHEPGYLPDRHYIHKLADFYGVTDIELLKAAGYIREGVEVRTVVPPADAERKLEMIRRVLNDRFEELARDAEQVGETRERSQYGT